jgi:single-strand DNA-binding protein
MRNFIDVTILGNVGRKPEIRIFDDGFKVARFSLAATERWTDKRTGDRKSKTEWVNVSVTNPKIIDAIFAPGYVDKGTPLLIRGGTLKTSKYEKDGVTHYNTEVVIGVGSMVQILERAPAKTPGDAEAPAEPVVAVADTADVPF